MPNEVRAEMPESTQDERESQTLRVCGERVCWWDEKPTNEEMFLINADAVTCWPMGEFRWFGGTCADTNSMRATEL